MVFPDRPTSIMVAYMDPSDSNCCRNPVWEPTAPNEVGSLHYDVGSDVARTVWSHGHLGWRKSVWGLLKITVEAQKLETP